VDPPCRRFGAESARQQDEPLIDILNQQFCRDEPPPQPATETRGRQGPYVQRLRGPRFRRGGARSRFLPINQAGPAVCATHNSRAHEWLASPHLPVTTSMSGRCWRATRRTLSNQTEPISPRPDRRAWMAIGPAGGFWSVTNASVLVEGVPAGTPDIREDGFIVCRIGTDCGGLAAYPGPGAA